MNDGDILRWHENHRSDPNICALLDAGCTPVYRPHAGGFTWILPEGFNPPWLYSDRSCGHYDENPYTAAQKCAASATFKEK